jgi:oxalate decarboxylase
MGSIHTFNIETPQPQAVRNGGTRTMANKRNFSLLKGMALYSLRLYSGGVREPHWHPNAAELSYCLSGRALMTIFSPGAGHDTFTVDTGEVVYVPKEVLQMIDKCCCSSIDSAIVDHNNSVCLHK